MANLTSFDDYKNKYSSVKLARTDTGIVTVAMHTDGGSVFWDGRIHGDLAGAFGDIAGDPDVSVVIFTGTGNNFIADFDWGVLDKEVLPPVTRLVQAGWMAQQLLINMLAVQVPVIAAVNGPCTLHSELALLCDVVVASDDACFQDATHVAMGVVPGDGMQIVWPLVVGPKRARYFLLTGQKISPEEARDWGAVDEVVPKPEVMARACALADELAKRPPLVLRYARSLLTQPFRKAIVEALDHGISAQLLAHQAFWPEGNKPMVNAWDQDPFPHMRPAKDKSE